MGTESVAKYLGTNTKCRKEMVRLASRKKPMIYYHHNAPSVWISLSASCVCQHAWPMTLSLDESKTHSEPWNHMSSLVPKEVSARR